MTKPKRLRSIHASKHHALAPGDDWMDKLTGRVTVQKDGCWCYPVHGKRPYPVLVINGRQELVHRLVYLAIHGPIPPGNHVHHTCENKTCINPAHLEALTPAEHNRRHRPSALGMCPAPVSRR